MADVWTFQPMHPSVALSAGTTTGNVAIPAGGTKVLLTNLGEVAVFVRLGGSDVEAAVATGMPVLAQDRLLVDRADYTHIAGITSASTASLQVTPGHGS